MPTVGLALGMGLFLGEYLTVARMLANSFGGVGLARELLPSLVTYLLVGAALDLLAQLLWPRAWKGGLLARGLPVLIVAVAAQARFGAYPRALYLLLPLALAFACAVHVRWGLPLAAGIVANAAITVFASPSALPSAASVAGEVATGPSYVVVVMDTVRRDHTSAYGYERDTTPNLKALAARGVRFDRAYATSCWTLASHASLFTGLSPAHHHATWEHLGLGRDLATMATLYAAHGYETAGFSGNPYVSAGTGLSRGYSRFVEAWRPHVMRRLLVVGQMWARYGSGSRDKGGAQVVDEVRRWLAARDARRPYLMFVNLMEAHGPYQDSPLAAKFADATLTRGDLDRIGRRSHDAQWLGTRVPQELLPATVDLLDGAIASSDMYLGQILAAVGDRATVVVLADHGDMVGEHRLFGHMSGLYEPLIHIPMVMAGPGVPSGRVEPSPVSVVDILPTLLDLAGVAVLPGDGVSLVPLLRGDNSGQDRVVYASHDRNPALNMWRPNWSSAALRALGARKGAAVAKDKKRVVSEDGSDLGYDLVNDPLEERPYPGAETGLGASAPTKQMRPPDEPPVELDPAQIEALRALGYIH